MKSRTLLSSRNFPFKMRREKEREAFLASFSARREEKVLQSRLLPRTCSLFFFPPLSSFFFFTLVLCKYTTFSRRPGCNEPLTLMTTLKLQVPLKYLISSFFQRILSAENNNLNMFEEGVFLTNVWINIYGP